MTAALRVDILTTFPEIFAWDDHSPVAGSLRDGRVSDSPADAASSLWGLPALSASIPARARRAGAITWRAHNLRAFAASKHDKTDDRPFGGGPGMVMMCQPVWDAVAAVEALDPRPATRVYLTPQGVPLRQPLVRELATRPRLLLLAGHYEGVDERVIEALAPIEISIGDYVLSGGELAAMVLIDAIARLLPGVLGHELSAAQDSFAVAPVPPTAPALPAAPAKAKPLSLSPSELLPGATLLDCPHYTRPRVWMGREVPPVLLSGDHQAVERWRTEQRLARTLARRPDLLEPS
jgi:tRNA (guanine37-N1)-methyltransferase